MDIRVVQESVIRPDVAWSFFGNEGNETVLHLKASNQELTQQELEEN